MSEAVQERSIPEELETLRTELDNRWKELEDRRDELNKQKEQQDKQEKKLKRSRLFGRIFLIVMAVLCVVMLVIKYVTYFKPEKVNYDSRTQVFSEDSVDTSSLQIMPYNDELTVACQPMLLADSRDHSLQLDFISAPTTKVLVRAEVFTDRKNLGNRKCRLFWHDVVYPDDESLVRIAATGWVRPGEMVEKIKLDELPTRMGDVTVRFTAVNPANTKISSGVFTMNTVLYIVDYQGNMLNENGEWVQAG